MLDDGDYEAMIVDAAPGSQDGVVVLDLVVVAGPHKGEVVQVNAQGMAQDPLELLAVPATLRVVDGRPDVTIDA